jgi:hypothetical protein
MRFDDFLIDLGEDVRRAGGGGGESAAVRLRGDNMTAAAGDSAAGLPCLQQRLDLTHYTCWPRRIDRLRAHVQMQSG